MVFTRKMQVEEVDNGYVVTTFKEGRFVASSVASTGMKVGLLATEWARGEPPDVDTVTEPKPIEKMLIEAMADIIKWERPDSPDGVYRMAALARAAITKADEMAAGEGD